MVRQIMLLRDWQVEATVGVAIRGQTVINVIIKGHITHYSVPSRRHMRNYVLIKLMMFRKEKISYLFFHQCLKSLEQAVLPLENLFIMSLSQPPNSFSVETGDKQRPSFWTLLTT